MNICKLFFAIALGLFALTKPAALGQSETKPNLIFILADDLGYGDLGCFGQKKIKTPRPLGQGRDETHAVLLRVYRLRAVTLRFDDRPTHRACLHSR